MSPDTKAAPLGGSAKPAPLHVRRSLFLRVMGFMLLGSLAPVAFVALLGIHSTRQILVEDWNVLQTQVGQSVSSVISAQLRAAVSELAALDAGLREASGRVETGSLLAGGARPILEPYLRKGGSALRVDLYDLNGNAARVGIADADLTRRMDETYRSTRASGSAAVSMPLFCRAANQLMVVVARPLDNGTVRAGVLAAAVSLEPALRAIRDGSWSGIRVFVADREGRLIADLDRNRMTASVDYSGHEIVRTVLAETRSFGTVTRPIIDTIDTIDGAAVPMIGTGVMVPESGWVVVAQTPRDRAYAGITNVLLRMGLLGAGALLLTLSLAAFLSDRMIQPLRQLAESARQVSGGNFSAEIPLGDPSEIGAVARAFDDMRHRIEETFTNMRLAVEDSKQLFLGSVRALANAIDGKDPYTRGHTERVSRFSVEIARIMELPEEELEKIKIGGLLHDVGKIAVDDKILKKPGVLTDDEYQIMKTHPQRGYEMMRHIPQLKEIIPAMYSHHESLDGKGYPQGLKGDQIPMIARIVMVADCFDAMTTKRPYQDPAPIDYVLGTIRSLAGKKYDERVVEALVRGVKTGRIVPHTAT